LLLFGRAGDDGLEAGQGQQILGFLRAGAAHGQGQERDDTDAFEQGWNRFHKLSVFSWLILAGDNLQLLVPGLCESTHSWHRAKLLPRNQQRNFYQAGKKATAILISRQTGTHELQRIFKIISGFSGRHTGCLSVNGY
jgi:hypothetical protein